MQSIASYEPIEDTDCTLLILGTMPSPESLRCGEYYAHAQNAFWRILLNIYGNLEITAHRSVTFADKRALLLRYHTALWDVLARCEREGSGDAAIKNEVPNDIEEFLTEHAGITRIVFNGRAAEGFFRRYFKNVCLSSEYKFAVLPSTSPANAMRYEKKLDAWRSVLTQAV